MKLVKLAKTLLKRLLGRKKERVVQSTLKHKDSTCLRCGCVHE